MDSIWHLGGLRWNELLRRVARQFRLDHILDQSAQLSYYFFFAIFPMLLFLTALLGLFVEPGSFLHRVIDNYAGAVLPHSAAGYIDRTLQEISRGSNAGKLSIGLLVALWSASSGMGAIIKCLNIAYNAKEERPWWKQKAVAILLTIVVAALILGAFLLVIYGGRMARIAASYLGLGHPFEIAWRVARWPVLLPFVLLAFNLVYYFAPSIKHCRWHWLMPGTVVGAGLWLLISIGFRFYLRFFNHYSVAYGSIGAIIILLLWFYLSGIAMLIGGEVNAQIEKAIADPV